MIFLKKKYIVFISVLGLLVPNVSICLGQTQTNPAINQYYEAVEFYKTGDYEESLRILENALVSMSEDDTLVQISINNLSGILNTTIGNYDGALKFYKKNLKLINGKNSKKKSKTYNNIGTLFKTEGKYFKAIEYYNESIKLIINSSLAEKEKLRLLSLEYYNIGIVYFNIKDYKTAILYYKKSLLIREEQKFTGIDKVYFNLARVYSKTKQFEKADDYFKAAIKLREEEYGESYHRSAPLYMHYGDFLIKQKKFITAKKYLLKAISIYLQNYKRKHPFTADSYVYLGKYYTAVQKHDSALDCFQQSLISDSKKFNSEDINENPVIDDCFSGLQLLRSLKEKAKAIQNMANERENKKQIELYQLSLRTTDIALNLISKLRKEYISPDSKLIITEKEKECYSLGVKASVKLFELINETMYAEKAYRYASASKASVLSDNLEEKKEILELVPFNKRIIKAEIEQKISAYKRLIYEENEKLKADSAKISLWNSKLFELNNDYDVFIEGMKKQYHIPEINKKDLVSIKNIQAQLAEKTTLIEYFISKDADSNNQILYVFIIDKYNFKLVQSVLSNSFEKNIEIFKKRTNSFDYVKSNIKSYNAFNKVCYNLNSELFEPIKDSIHTENIIIIPDEDIAFISFDVLLSEYEECQSINYAELPFLIYKYCFSYAYSVNLLFQHSTNQYSDFVHAFAPEYNDTLRNLLRKDFGNLTETKKEIQSILKYFKGNPFIGSTATENNFKVISGEGGILHLAMHASTEENQKEFSFLAFTDYLYQPDSDDGILFSYEIEKMNIKSPMVVLSACNTGKGKLYSGEGVYSLSRSFLRTGVPAVVFSLWNVNDAAGSKIMALFYEKLSEAKSKNVALREAKLAYINSSSPSLINPVYWSGYILSGDVSEVVKPNKVWHYLIGVGGFLSISLLIIVRRRMK